MEKGKPPSREEFELHWRQIQSLRGLVEAGKKPDATESQKQHAEKARAKLAEFLAGSRREKKNP